MQSLASTMNTIWGVLAIAAQVASLVLLVSLLSKKTPAFLAPFVRFVGQRGNLVAFIVSVLATLGSLIYSDVIGYAPCKLCWFQRIFMYPQVILFAVALWKKDSFTKLQGIVFSSIGALIALYHYVGQLGWNPFGLECLALGYSASCSKNFVLEFGYMTIPMMAFAAFILILMALLVSMKADKGTTLS